MSTAGDQPPPPPLFKRRNTVLRLFDAPLYRDWIFWLVLFWIVVSGASLSTDPPEDGTPIWLSTLLGMAVFAVLFGIVPAWLRLLFRRWRWKRRAPAGLGGATNSSTSDDAEPTVPTAHAGPPAVEPFADRTPALGRSESRGRPPRAEDTVRSSKILREARHSLPFPTARAVRAFQVASASKDQYEALLDAAEALTVTLGITVAAFFRTRVADGAMLDQLHKAYVTKGVAQGVWLDLVNRMRRYARQNPDRVPPAWAVLEGLPDAPGIAADLETLVQERNRAAHGGRPRDANEATERVAEFRGPLERALAGSGFLVEFPWVLTDTISYQAQTKQFRVVAHQVMGDHPEFERLTFLSSEPLPENTVYVLWPDGPISLSPLIVSRYCDECRRDEVFYAERLRRTEGVGLRSFGRAHVLFDPGLNDEVRSLADQDE